MFLTKRCSIKKIIIYLPGFIFIILGIIFSPSFIADQISPDGILLNSTIERVQILRIIVLLLGAFVIFFTSLLTRQQRLFSCIVSLLNNNILILFIVFISTLFYLFMRIRYNIDVHNEGVSVYTAIRILNGEVPYRDFYTGFPSAESYIFAFLFKIFSPSLLVERVYSTITNFLIIVCSCWITKKLVSQKFALISWFLTTMWIVPFGYYGYAVPHVLLFSLLSCICIIKFILQERHWGILLAGILTGIATFFRLDIGGYVFISSSIVLISFMLSKRYITHTKKFFESLHIWGKYLIGNIITMLFIILLFLFIYNIPFQRLISDLITPTRTIPQFYSLPYPTLFPDPTQVITGRQTPFQYIITSLERIPFYFPFAIFAIIIFKIGVCMRRRRLSKEEWSIFYLLLLGITFFNRVRIRSDSAHLLPVIIYSIILFCFLVSDFIQKDKIKIYGMRLFLYFVIFLIIISLSLDFFRTTAATFFVSPIVTPLGLKRAKGIYLLPHHTKSLQDAVKFIQKCVPEEQKIFVGNSRHDRSSINDAMFYFLAERNSATKYHLLDPTLIPTYPVQIEIINELNKFNVNYIVLWDGAEDIIEPNESGKSSGVTVLDDFIKYNYELIKCFGHYTIYKRYFH